MTEVVSKLSISLPRPLAEAARARSGDEGLSAYIAAALTRQLERDNLDDLIEGIQSERGVTPHDDVVDANVEVIRAARARLRRKS